MSESGKRASKTQDKHDFFEFVGYFVRGYPKHTLIIIAALLASSLADGFGLVTLIPLLEITVDPHASAGSALGNAVRAALETVGVSPTVGVMLALVVVLVCIKSLFLWISLRQVGFAATGVATDLKLKLLRALTGARWGYFVTQPAGRITNALSGEANKAASSYQLLCTLFAGTLSVVIYSVVAMLFYWQVVAVGLLVGVGVMALLRSRVAVSRSSGKAQMRLSRAINMRLVDMLQGLKAVKASGREQNFWPLLERETRELNLAQRRHIAASAIVDAIREPLVVVVLALMLFYLVGYRNEPLSSVLVLALLFHRVMSRVTLLQHSYQAMVVGEASFWSLREAMLVAERNRESFDQGRPATGVGHGIRFDAVSFGYAHQPVLDGVSLWIPAGRFVAVSGSSGAGKTTLIDLIAGLYRPQRGNILVDDVSLADLDMQGWRSGIGYVPQEMTLFHETIYTNVTYGDPRFTREDCVEALKKAEAWEFVNTLEHGMDTVVGERGARLSGGQRQRIALARALVSLPSLLILDEVTSGLDPVTEAAICSTLSRLSGRTTLVAVSHQPAVLRAADLVYQLEHGSIRVLRGSGIDPAAIPLGNGPGRSDALATGNP